MIPDKGARGPLSMVMGLVNSKTRFVSLTAIVMAVGLLLLVPGSVEGHHRAGHDRGPRPGSEIVGSYIVLLSPGASGDAVRRANDVRNPRSYQVGFYGFVGEIPQGRLNAMRNDPRVQAIIPDRVIRGQPGRPGRSKKTGSMSSSEVVPEGVRRIGAAPIANLGVTGAGIGIAIVDSGIDLNHVDLNVSSTCFDAFGGDCRDDSGHGTHVAGAIAAKRNGAGVVGVAPGATVYAVKVLDAEAGGSDSGLLAGLDWILTNADRVSPKIRIANLSLGRPGNIDDNAALRASINALINAGIVVIVSAGNDPDLAATAQVPAAFPEVITVASTTAVPGSNSCSKLGAPIAADTVSFFSSYSVLTGSSGVDIAAPGSRQENVDSACIVEPVGILSLFPSDSLAEMSGTSMAAPLVSGVAALLLERNPGLSVDAVTSAIVSGATNKTTAPALAVVMDRSVPLSGGVLSAPGALAAIQ